MEQESGQGANYYRIQHLRSWLSTAHEQHVKYISHYHRDNGKCSGGLESWEDISRPDDLLQSSRTENPTSSSGHPTAFCHFLTFSAEPQPFQNISKI